MAQKSALFRLTIFIWLKLESSLMSSGIFLVSALAVLVPPVFTLCVISLIAAMSDEPRSKRCQDVMEILSGLIVALVRRRDDQSSKGNGKHRDVKSKDGDTPSIDS